MLYYKLVLHWRTMKTSLLHQLKKSNSLLDTSGGGNNVSVDNWEIDESGKRVHQSCFPYVPTWTLIQKSGNSRASFYIALPRSCNGWERSTDHLSQKELILVYNDFRVQEPVIEHFKLSSSKYSPWLSSMIIRSWNGCLWKSVLPMDNVVF